MEVQKYKTKVILCASLYVPISVLIWIVPYSKFLKGFMIVVPLFRGSTLYILLCFIMASII
jgi:hypothetical protein